MRNRSEKWLMLTWRDGRCFMTGLLTSHLVCQIAEQIKWHRVNLTSHQSLSFSLLHWSPEVESNFYQTFIHLHGGKIAQRHIITTETSMSVVLNCVRLKRCEAGQVFSVVTHQALRELFPQLGISHHKIHPRSPQGMLSRWLCCFFSFCQICHVLHVPYGQTMTRTRSALRGS